MTTAQFFSLLDTITCLQSIDSLQTIILETRIELARAKEDCDSVRYEQLRDILTVAIGQSACILESTGKED